MQHDLMAQWAVEQLPLVHLTVLNDNLDQAHMVTQQVTVTSVKQNRDQLVTGSQSMGKAASTAWSKAFQLMLAVPKTEKTMPSNQNFVTSAVAVYIERALRWRASLTSVALPDSAM